MSVIQRVRIESMIYSNGIERIACSDICGKREQVKSGITKVASLPFSHIELDAFDTDIIWQSSFYKEFLNYLRAIDKESLFRDIKVTVSLLSQKEAVSFPNLGITDCRLYGLCKATFKGHGLIRQVSLPITPDLGERLLSSVLDGRLVKEMQTVRLGKKRRISCNLDAAVKGQSAGYFFHEIVGHCLEADIATARTSQSVAKAWAIGSTISQCHLSIYDDPFASQYHCFGEYDDEGVELHRTPLVLDDVLVGYMCNRYYAERYGLERCSGCSRRQSFRSEAIPRMSSTVVEFKDPDDKNQGVHRRSVPDSHFEVEQIISGNMLIDTRMFRIVCSGYLYQSGRAAAYSPNAMLSGDIEGSLKRVIAIDDGTAAVESPFFCFKKGQRVFASAKAPSIVLKSIDISGDFYEL